MTGSRKSSLIVLVVMAVIFISSGYASCSDAASGATPRATNANLKKYDLVFEGGGANGMVFVGAYNEFRKRGHTYGRLLGTSAGAITAVLIAAGYTPEEMFAALKEQENGKSVFSGFMGEPRPFTQAEIQSSAVRNILYNINVKFVPDFVERNFDDAITQNLAENKKSRHLFAFVERGGWYSADRFVTWLQSKLDSGIWKNGQRRFSRMTLSQFFAETKVELSLVASDTTDGTMLVLNHRTAPNCPVVWAVRMSMSIPLLWDEVNWDAGWGQYRGRDISGHVIVDGGILSNFPLELFISDEPQVTSIMGPKQNNSVLGLLIDESMPVPSRGLLVDVNLDPEELKTVKRLRRLVDTMTGAHDKMVIESFEYLVVRLPAAGYGTTEFNMRDARRTALVQAGQMAMVAYFDKPASRGEAAIARGLSKTDRLRQPANYMATKMIRR
jgi:NTE family protein